MNVEDHGLGAVSPPKHTGSSSTLRLPFLSNLRKFKTASFASLHTLNARLVQARLRGWLSGTAPLSGGTVNDRSPRFVISRSVHCAWPPQQLVEAAWEEGAAHTRAADDNAAGAAARPAPTDLHALPCSVT